MLDLVEETHGQIVKTASPSNLIRLWSRLYQEVSTKEFPGTWFGYPEELNPLLKTVLQGKSKDKNLRFSANTDNRVMGDFRIPRSCPVVKDAVLVGYAGGKDATAAILRLQRMGKHPIGFYVKGINRAYPHEEQAVKNLCEILDIPLVVQEIQVSGKSDWIENPIKNQFILALMFDYGVRRGITEYCQGNLQCDNVATQDFGSGFSDSHEMFRATDDFFRALHPDYTYHHLLKNDTDSFLTIWRHNHKILESVHSCMGPLRYKENLRRHNQEKYNIRLMQYRCGSCYKDYIEFIHLTEVGAVHNPPYLMKCWDGLVEVLPRILGPGKYTKHDAEREFFDFDLLNSFHKSLK